jgi:hypothetical protein
MAADCLKQGGSLWTRIRFSTNWTNRKTFGSQQRNVSRRAYGGHLLARYGGRWESCHVANNRGRKGRLHHLVSFGLVLKRIADAVAKCRPDLVAMGVKKLAAPRAAAHLYWSTAHHLVGRAQCPVLTIRH